MKAVDWEQVARELDAEGHAVIDGLVTPENCAARGTVSERTSSFHFCNWRIFARVPSSVCNARMSR